MDEFDSEDDFPLKDLFLNENAERITSLTASDDCSGDLPINEIALKLQNESKAAENISIEHTYNINVDYDNCDQFEATAFTNCSTESHHEAVEQTHVLFDMLSQDVAYDCEVPHDIMLVECVADDISCDPDPNIAHLIDINTSIQ